MQITALTSGLLLPLAAAIPLDKLLGHSSSTIQSISYPNTCVAPSTPSSELGNGVPITLTACKSGRYGGPPQSWTVPDGRSGPIKVGDLCLDAGDDPHDGGDVKLWECYDSLPQQTWTVNGDGTVETADGQCLNVRKESEGDEKEMQTWACNAEDPQNRTSVESRVSRVND